MKIFGVGPTSSSSEVKRKDKASAKPGEFARHLDSASGSDAAEGAAVDQVAAASDVGALLAVQAMSDASDREARRRLIMRGEKILERLDELRVGLLEGRVPKESLMELARTVRDRRESVADPGLAAVLDEIELRAQVELAKLSQRR